jgi:hypothetical protein
MGDTPTSLISLTLWVASRRCASASPKAWNEVKVSGTSGPLTLKCTLDDVDTGNPSAGGHVWAEVASLSAIPATP